MPLLIVKKSMCRQEETTPKMSKAEYFSLMTKMFLDTSSPTQPDTTEACLGLQENPPLCGNGVPASEYKQTHLGAYPRGWRSGRSPPLGLNLKKKINGNAT